MELTNFEMDTYLQELKKISGKVTGKLGYAVARNIRKIANEVVEYQNLKDSAIRTFGEKDAEGRYAIQIGTEAFLKFEEEMAQYTDIKHDVPICMVNEEELFSSSLNANEILSIDFMIKEDDTETTDE